MTDPTRPLISIEDRTPKEVFDIMCDRIRASNDLVGEMEKWRETLNLVRRIAEPMIQVDDVWEDATNIVSAIDAALSNPVVEMVAGDVTDEMLNAGQERLCEIQGPSQ